MCLLGSKTYWTVLKLGIEGVIYLSYNLDSYLNVAS